MDKGGETPTGPRGEGALVTDRKPLEKLFDFPTSNEPGSAPMEPAGDAAPGAVEQAQQDLLFDEELAPSPPAPRAPHSGEFEGLQSAEDFGEEDPWPEASAPTGADDSAAVAGEVTLAERWLSGAADALLLLAVLCVALLSMLPLGLVPSQEQWPGFVLFLGSFSFMYCTFPLAFWGQTPGMAWRGLRAINHDGLSLSFSQTTLRWLGGVGTLLLGGLPLVVALSGRSIADRLSGSWTIRT